jgi:hypothetical protein
LNIPVLGREYVGAQQLTIIRSRMGIVQAIYMVITLSALRRY